MKAMNLIFAFRPIANMVNLYGNALTCLREIKKPLHKQNYLHNGFKMGLSYSQSDFTILKLKIQDWMVKNR